MKKTLVVLLGGYYPYYGNPMGIVFEKLRPYLVGNFEVIVVSLRNMRAPNPGEELRYGGVTVCTVSSVLHQWLSMSGFKRLVAVFLCKLRVLCGGITSLDYRTSIYSRALERVLKTRDIYAVLSMSFPMNTLIAGAKFKKKHPSVKFVTYSTDTYYNDTNATMLRGGAASWLMNRRREKELSCYKMADWNFFSREIFRAHEGRLRCIGHKAQILDYTISCDSSSQESAKKILNPEDINLVYSGGVGRPMRDPRYFANVFLSLPADSRCVLHIFLLPSSEAFFQDTADLDSHVVFHPPVSPDLMRAIMNDADVLVNLGNDSDVFCPSKVFDYISTGRPIVSVVYRGRKKIDALSRLPNVLEIENYGDARSDASRLLSFCEKMKGVRLSFKEIERLLPEYRAECVSRKLMNKLI